MKHIMLLAILGAALLLTGCIGGQVKAAYRRVSAEEAQQIMKTESGYRIVDVRTHEEYASGHIPNAICIPNESIGKQPPTELSDKKQLLLIYCRSGRRSKEAANKLVELGYENVVDFGGIIDWPGEKTTEPPRK
ncbi:MAG: rhodanese-like domain-containing protein [Schwartzia succinivorans]|jgi:rhodanese-related sulfurtransferase|uniref:rhodanese-like domain-containing protein n=1 Tax=Schwartzia succinivorans TaxID=55507 RepID=UPI0023566399|nr:rhodanese-like domain-containing protein [Schwartzia succinivorans]MBE6097493.1 rhodanese-like domain-containing protein [Schwartzia succinivorans]